MSRPVLVDSSWYIRMMRERKDPLQALTVVSIDREIATCGMVKAEVGRGIKDPEKLKRYDQAWSVMTYVESSFSRWDETLNLSWQMDRNGFVLPIQDVHIAACALYLGAVILTYDKHFSLIPGVDSTDVIY